MSYFVAMTTVFFFHDNCHKLKIKKKKLILISF